MKNYFVSLVIFCACFGCSNQPPSVDTSNAPPAKAASPAPTLSAAEQERKKAEHEKEYQQAVNDFLRKSYKGWRLAAVSDPTGECRDYAGYSDNVCDIMISNGNQEKVVAVKFKRFNFVDGTEKLVVYEPKPFEIVKARIRENTLKNLTADDISDDLRESIVAGANE